MRAIGPPEYYNKKLTVFLAGGITGAGDWQKELSEKLSDVPIILFNPRRDFDVKKYGEEAEKQIEWEFHHLKIADVTIFWFPAEAQCMITLFELGAFSSTKKSVIVGVHPDYCRRFDIWKQMSLARPEIFIVDSLDGIVSQILDLIPTEWFI